MRTGNDIRDLESLVGATWPNLKQARDTTEAFRAKLAHAMAELDSEDLSVVAFGTLGRGEFTEGSDLDWTLLVDGAADPDHFEQALKVADVIQEVVAKQPGREGTFGKLIFSHDLVHRIGGEDDTNSNTTRRSLVLLEAVALARDDALERLTKAILRRYILEDLSFVTDSANYRVPRFLLNDFARYWRTMAVDFAYKRRQRHGKGAALRNLKLRISRKLLFASALIACFSFELGLTQRRRQSDGNATEAELVQALRQFLGKTPLDMLAAAFVLVISKASSEALRGRCVTTASNVFDAYDEFIAALADKQKRDHLEKLDPVDIDNDETFGRLRASSHTFRDGLLTLFFDLNAQLSELTRFYGVF